MTDTTQPNLSRFLADSYPRVKSNYPGEGRRKWRLRVAQEFWALSPEQRAVYSSSPPVSLIEADEAEYSIDDDPLDSVTVEAPGLGLLLRTDFSDEEAWKAFSAKLQDAETEFASDPESGEPMPQDSAQGEEIDEDEDEEEDGAAPVFHVIDPPPHNRPLFTNISNLTALRLLNDVDARIAPSPPRGEKRIKPPNRLVDHDGWQEVYTGKMVWIYDALSNRDQCVRLVSQQSAAMYGTATADSWRARVSHICELQVNLASGAMSIDFGGLDRWDHNERVRNMEEATKPIG